MISNCSKSYQAYEQVAHPEAGTKVPAGKPDADPEESLKQAPSVARAGSAKNLAGTEHKGACLEAVHKQGGKHWDDMSQTKAGNAPDDELEY